MQSFTMVYLPDGGFRLDFLTWWGAPDPDHPTAEDKTRYDLLINGEESRCYSTITIEEFTAAVRDAEYRASRPRLGG